MPSMRTQILALVLSAASAFACGNPIVLDEKDPYAGTKYEKKAQPTKQEAPKLSTAKITRARPRP
jgi:hypothetical protein